MIRFESIFKNELSEFLLVREASLSKSAFDHDCHYLQKFDDYLIRCECRINGVLTLKHTKGEKQRLVPMHISLVIILRSYCMAMGLIGKIDSFLFPSASSDTPMSTKTAFHRFENILKLSDISLPGRRKYQRGPCLHCLRHVFAFKSFAKAEKDGRGINDSVPYLSIYLGHDSLKETEKYLKFSSEMYPEAMELFEDYTIPIFPEVDYEK